MEWSLGFFALATFAVLFAGVSKGGFGSGASFAAAPMLALILDPKLALGVLLPTLFAMDLAALRPFWRAWHWPTARLLILGAVPGVALGIVLIQIADADLFRLLIGGVALGYVAYELARARGLIAAAPKTMSPALGFLFGAVAGFTSFVSHAGGPVAAVYLLSQRLDKTTYQATTVLVFGMINVLKLPSYIMLGMIPRETWGTALLLCPLALVGVALGVWMHRRVSGKLFFQLTYAFLICAGLKLIYDGLT